MNRKDNMQIPSFLRSYNKLSGADLDFVGFEYKGFIYITIFERIPASICYKTRESTSKGGQPKVCIRMNNKQKEKYIKNGKAVQLMTYDDLMAIPTNQNTNRGHKLEKYFATLHAAENPHWKEGGHDRFDKGGDVVIDGLQVQIKFGNASLTNVDVLHRAQDAARARKHK